MGQEILVTIRIDGDSISPAYLHELEDEISDRMDDLFNLPPTSVTATAREL